MPAFSFVLINQSPLATAAGLTLDVLTKTVNAFRVDWNTKFGPEWGSSASFRVDSSTSNVDPSECAMLVQDQLVGAPGAAGYHDRLINGASVAYIGWLDSVGKAAGPQAIAQFQLTTDHEAKEVGGDPGANLWAGKADVQTEEAIETCDRVEDTYYVDDQGVTHSNFLRRCFFTPGMTGPYDFLGVLKSQDDMTPGGYAIQRVAGQANDVGPSGRRIFIAGREKSIHHHPSSRAHRRGFRHAG